MMPNKIFTQLTTNINIDVKLIDCGNGRIFTIKNVGNDYGYLGLGDNTDRNTFTEVPRGF